MGKTLLLIELFANRHMISCADGASFHNASLCIDAMGPPVAARLFLSRMVGRVRRASRGLREKGRQWSSTEKARHMQGA